MQILIQARLPVDYQDISFESLLNLLCAHDFSGVPCYSQLSLNTDVVSNNSSTACG